MDTTVTVIIAGILALATIAGAIMTIWLLFEKINKKFSETVNDKVEQALIKNNAIQEKETKLLLDNFSNEHLLRIEILRAELLEFKEEQQETNEANSVITKHQTYSILETFKQDIRDIYFKLRETGVIEDKDKSYVDKIYTYYVALGGNSDIHAKVKEIHEVYSRRTTEMFDEKAKQTKAKKAKQKEEENKV